MDNPEENTSRKRKHSSADNYEGSNSSSNVKIKPGPSHAVTNASDSSASCSYASCSSRADYHRTNVIVSPSCSRNTGSSKEVININDNSDDSSSPANFDKSDVFAFPSCSYSAGPSHASDYSAGCSSRANCQRTNVIVSPSCSRNTGSSLAVTNSGDNLEDSLSPANFDTSKVIAFPSCSNSAGSSLVVINAGDNLEDSLSPANFETSNVIAFPSCSNSPGFSLTITNVGNNLEDSSSPADFDTSNVIANPSCSNSTVLGTSKKPNCYSELPEAVMQNIYRSLPLEDLINIRDVCDSWKEFTDKSSVWKHAPFYLNDNNITELSRTPYIHTVTGVGLQTELCVNALVNNLQDLRVLDITFNPCITTEHVQKLVNKFVNLESIKLDPSAPNVVETVSILKDCTKLKEVKFLEFPTWCFDSWRPILKKLCKIESLNTFDFYPISQRVLSYDILQLLDRIMKQLVTLKLCIDTCTRTNFVKDISTIMSKIICHGERLETLNFSTSIVTVDDIILNFAKLEKLKSLKFQVHPKAHLGIVAQVTFPTSLQFIELSFMDMLGTQNILKRVIESCPNLKHLHASYIPDEDINEQLEQINTLQHLHTIILEYCLYLSTEGFQHIGNCSELRVLKFTKTSLDDTACNSLKSCKYLQELKLERCNIRPEMLVPTILDLERLTQLHLVECYQRNDNGKVWFSAEYLRDIFRECKERNHVLNVTVVPR